MTILSVWMQPSSVSVLPALQASTALSLPSSVLSTLDLARREKALKQHAAANDIAAAKAQLAAAAAFDIAAANDIAVSSRCHSL